MGLIFGHKSSHWLLVWNESLWLWPYRSADCSLASLWAFKAFLWFASADQMVWSSQQLPPRYVRINSRLIKLILLRTAFLFRQTRVTSLQFVVGDETTDGDDDGTNDCTNFAAIVCTQKKRLDGIVSIRGALMVHNVRFPELGFDCRLRTPKFGETNRKGIERFEKPFGSPASWTKHCSVRPQTFANRKIR